HRARAGDRPPPGEGLLLPQRLRGRPRLWPRLAARGGGAQDVPVRGVSLPLRALAALRDPGRLRPGLGGLPPRRGLPVLLVPSQEPRGERVLGRSRRAPPERGVQPRRRPAPGRFPGRVLVGLLSAPGRDRLPAPPVPD